MFEKKYTLLRSQKKQVYDILREVGLEPAEFFWSDVEIVERLSVSRLNHRGGQHYFQFSSYEMNAWCVACPGMYRTMDYEYPKRWGEQEEIFRNWAKNLKRELDTRDPWVELAKYQVALDGGLSAETANEPIPAIEAERIGQDLLRLADSVGRMLSLDDGQAAMVRAKLGYLADAARRERSHDWVYMTLGVWASTAVALALTEEQAATLWRMLKCELGSFVNLLLARFETPPPPTRQITAIKPRGDSALDRQSSKKSSAPS